MKLYSFAEVLAMWPPGTNAKRLKQMAKTRGCCRKLGRVIAFTQGDLEELLECCGLQKSKTPTAGMSTARSKASEYAKALQGWRSRMDSEGWRPTGELRFVKRLVDAPEYGRYEDGTAKVSREARILQQRLKKQGILDTPSRYEWRSCRCHRRLMRPQPLSSSGSSGRRAPRYAMRCARSVRPLACRT